MCNERPMYIWHIHIYGHGTIGVIRWIKVPWVLVTQKQALSINNHLLFDVQTAYSSTREREREGGGEREGEREREGEGREGGERRRVREKEGEREKEKEDEREKEKESESEEKSVWVYEQTQRDRSPTSPTELSECRLLTSN